MLRNRRKSVAPQWESLEPSRSIAGQIRKSEQIVIAHGFHAGQTLSPIKVRVRHTNHEEPVAVQQFMRPRQHPLGSSICSKQFQMKIASRGRSLGE